MKNTIAYATFAASTVFLASLAFPLLAQTAAPEAPKPAAQPYVWRNVEVVGGGFVPGIVFHPTAPGLVYARTDIGGLYRLDEKTQRWIPLMDFLSGADWNLLGVESVGFDPTAPGRVYVAAGQYVNDWAGNGAILWSTDYGNTWGRTDMPFKMGGNSGGRSMGERLAVNPRKPAQLFFGSRNAGLWKSEDHARTWTLVEGLPHGDQNDKGCVDIGIPIVFFAPDNSLYAAVADRVINLYRSVDEGKTWKRIPGHPRGFLPHQAKFGPDGILYVTYGDMSGPNGIADGAVWKYDPASERWTDITPLRPFSGDESYFGYAALAVDSRKPGTVMVSTICRWGKKDDIFRTTDGGKTWKSARATSLTDASGSMFVRWGSTQPVEDTVGHWIGAMAIDPFNSDRAYYGTGATVWGTGNLTKMDRPQKGADKTMWTIRAQGLEETAVQDLISPPKGAHLHSAMYDIGGFTHVDLTRPASSMRVNPLMNNTGSLDFAGMAPDIIVRSGGGKPPIAISHDGGVTWKPLAGSAEGTTDGGRVSISADGSTILHKFRDKPAYITRDEGATWTPSTGLGKNFDVIADKTNPRRFYAFDWEVGAVFYSTDGGATFLPGATKLQPRKGSRFVSVPGREGDIWLANGGTGLLHSTDGGLSFASVGQQREVETFGFGKAPEGKEYPAIFVVAVVDGVHGVFRSDDAGAQWVRVNDDQHQYGWIGKIITGDPRIYGRVYLGTNGRGILYADIK